MNEYLEDQQRCHMVISELPKQLRQCLLYGRTFIYTLHQLCISLSKLGLLSFAKSENRIKEEVLYQCTCISSCCRWVSLAIYTITLDILFVIMDFYSTVIFPSHCSLVNFCIIRSLIHQEIMRFIHVYQKFMPL